MESGFSARTGGRRMGEGGRRRRRRLLFILLYVCRRVGAIVSTFCPVQVENGQEGAMGEGQVTLGSVLNGARAAYMH